MCSSEQNKLMKINYMRKNDIELRENEIVKWFPNHFYGQELQYEKIGDYYMDKDYMFIDKSMFEKTELCYALVFFNNGIPEFVDDRPLELDPKDVYDFLHVLKYALTK